MNYYEKGPLFNLRKRKNKYMRRRLALGDIHGRLDYLKDVLNKCNFDYENDLLIQLGDLVDRGPAPFHCMDELLKIKNLVLISGNHDLGFVQSIHDGFDVLGDRNGTRETFEAWDELDPEEQIHYLQDFFGKQLSHYITEDNICFVHGGFDRHHLIKEQSRHSLAWDREFVKEMMSCTGNQKLRTEDNFKEVFIGHTPTIYWDKTFPITRGGVTNVDTGSGKGGPLTIMDIDTKEFWQSDLTEADTNKLISYGIIKKDENTSSKKEGEKI